MKSASRDCMGSGLGYRSTTDEWRAKVKEAWIVAYKRVYKCDPDASVLFNAGM